MAHAMVSLARSLCDYGLVRLAIRVRPNGGDLQLCAGHARAVALNRIRTGSGRQRD